MVHQTYVPLQNIVYSSKSLGLYNKVTLGLFRISVGDMYSEDLSLNNGRFKSSCILYTVSEQIYICLFSYGRFVCIYFSIIWSRIGTLLMMCVSVFINKDA